MTLRAIEGFDAQASITKPPISITRSGDIAGPYGGNALSGLALWNDAAGVSTLILGFHHQTAVGTFTSSNAVKSLLAVKDSTAVDQFALFFTNTGTVQLVRGVPSSGVVMDTTALAYPSGQWNWNEIKMTIADSGGIFQWYVNGVLYLNFVGDTKNAGTSLISYAYLGVSGGGGAHLWDNLYVLDTVGSAPYNDYLGECKIETIRPSGNGSLSQLVGNDGNSTDNYLLVNETVPAIASYVGSPTIGNGDRYTHGDLGTVSGNVLAVQTTAFAYKTDAAAASLKTVQKLAGGTEYKTAAQALVPSPGAAVSTGPRVLDPAGAAWTIGSVNGSEFGVEVA